MSWVKVGCIIPAVSSSLRLEETAEIHPQVKLHSFVSLSGKQNKNNDNKKRNISFASWGFITWIFDSLIDNSEVLISCLLNTSFFLMSSEFGNGSIFMNKNQLFFHSVSFPRSIFSISSSWFQVHCIFFSCCYGFNFFGRRFLHCEFFDVSCKQEDKWLEITKNNNCYSFQ